MYGGGDRDLCILKCSFGGTIYMTITARNSGTSYLNRGWVNEWYLSRPFKLVPSNLNGTCFGESGKLDPHKLKATIDTATEVYIKRVNGAPCGDSKIQLFKGAKIYKKQQEKESCTWPQLLFMEEVWNICDTHAFLDLPSQYFSMLKCWLSPPLCQQPPKETQ